MVRGKFLRKKLGRGARNRGRNFPPRNGKLFDKRVMVQPGNQLDEERRTS